MSNIQDRMERLYYIKNHVTIRNTTKDEKVMAPIALELADKLQTNIEQTEYKVDFDNELTIGDVKHTIKLAEYTTDNVTGLAAMSGVEIFTDLIKSIQEQAVNTVITTLKSVNHTKMIFSEIYTKKVKENNKITIEFIADYKTAE